MALRAVPLASLRRLDPDLLRLPLVAELLARVERDGVRCWVPVRGRARAAPTDFLNRTFFSPRTGGDVLEAAEAPVDVIAHAAWHHVVRSALPDATVEAALLGEAIASAFDLYLVGAALRVAPESELLATQVPRMAEAAEDAGMSARAFQRVLEDCAKDPEAMFEELRALLVDASWRLARVDDPARAATVLDALGDRRLAPLLLHFDLSGWILFARARATHARKDPAARTLDRALRRAPHPLTWLERELVAAPPSGRRRRR